MSIHTTHPFDDGHREAGRQLRGRLGGRVTLWTSGDAGLTVSSLLVAAGEPWRVVAALSPDSDLCEGLLDRGVAAVSLLQTGHERLADAFAFVAPAPGGPFRVATWRTTDWGRVPDGTDTWAGVRLESTAHCGWLTLATCVIEHAEIGADERPLHHRRGRYESSTAG